MPRYIERSVGTVRMGKVRGLITQGAGLGPLILIERLYRLRITPEGTLIALIAKDVSLNLLTRLEASTKKRTLVLLEAAFFLLVFTIDWATDSNLPYYCYSTLDYYFLYLLRQRILHLANISFLTESSS